MKTIFDDLQQRGIIGQIIDIKALETNKCIRLYLGIDPTADSLHVGHLVTLITMKRFNEYGHKTYIVIGGATGMIGDPSFKSTERQFIGIQQIQANIIGIKKQIFNLLGENTEILNNADWYKDMSVIDFLRDAGKNITINYMTSKESVKKRIVSGISFTEFSYQLLQGYDFYHLHEKLGISLQIGGDDQWGNMTTGVEYMRKKGIDDANVMTIKLITKDDGTKFGKTETGTVWLDPQKTSPYEFYQFWLNRTDTEVEKYIKFFSMKDNDELDSLIAKHKQHPEQRLLQKDLAKEMTILIHGEQEFLNIETVSNIIFGDSDFNALISINNITHYLQNIPNITINKDDICRCKTYYDLLISVAIPTLFTSKNEIKRSIQEKSVYINKNKINDDDVVDSKIFSNEFLLIQRGKKKHLIVFLQ